MFKYNETRLVMSGGRLKIRCQEAWNKEQSRIDFPRVTTVASLLTHFVASGTVFFCVYVLKGKLDTDQHADSAFALEGAPKANRRSWP